jgi:hypothetical protein
MGYNRWTNIGFLISNLDRNVSWVKALPVSMRRPIRPYFMHVLMNRTSWLWWQQMPLPTEEARAAACLGLFTGIDGEDWWGYCDYHSNLQLPPDVAKGLSDNGYCDVMVKDTLTGTNVATSATRTFTRYDALHVTALDTTTGVATFQFIVKDDRPNNWGVGATYPYYTAKLTDMTPHLRSYNDDWPGIFEGLAMAKQVEYFLKYGTIMRNDFDYATVYENMLPIGRRVKLGSVSIVATYDPLVVVNPTMTRRNVVYTNFDGVAGLNLTFPADAQVRIWVINLTPPAA